MSSKHMERLSQFCQCFTEINRIKIYLTLGAPNSFLLSPVNYALLFQYADFHDAPKCGPDQCKCSQWCYMFTCISLFFQCEQKDVSGIDFSLEPFLCPCHWPWLFRGLPSSPLHLQIVTFSQMAFLKCYSLPPQHRYLYWIQYLIHDVAFCLLINFIFYINAKCLLSFTLYLTSGNLVLSISLLWHIPHLSTSHVLRQENRYKQ